MQKAKPDLSFDFREAHRTQVRPCDHPACRETGEFRAPKGRERLNDFYWFCLTHVREYNSKWDFYAGMSPDQIERHQRRDTTWQRPSWPLGHWRTRERYLRDRVMNGGFAFGHGWGEEGAERHRPGPEDAPPRPPTAEDEAFATLDMAPSEDFAEIKARYRELVKVHHPDANGGDKTAEERLKRINTAYTTLKASFGIA